MLTHNIIKILKIIFFIYPLKQKEYHYRNVRSDDAVSEESTLICDPFGYAIADMAIDKYIRDWGGSDILYDVLSITDRV